MTNTRTLTLLMVCAAAFTAAPALGQLNQLNGGGGGAAAGGGGGGQTGDAAGGTTEAAGGVTGQAPGAAVNEAVAGANAAQAFIGGGNTDGGFVGGGLQNLVNQANRQFRAITQAQTPTGGTRDTSGTPRQVPVSLRIGFAVPQADGRTSLIEPGGTPISRIAFVKPELRNISVSVNDKGVATLTGSAPDLAARRLAVNLVRLRPGVRQVRDQLAVDVPATPQ